MSPAIENSNRFIVLPTRGLRATPDNSGQSLQDFLTALSTVRSPAAAAQFVSDGGLQMSPAFRVLDSVAADGPKLVEMSMEVANELKANQPGLRIIPEKTFAPLRVRYEVAGSVPAAVAIPWVVRVSDATGRPVGGARVVAFTTFANRTGAQADTDPAGMVQLNLGGAACVDRLYVYAHHTYWGAFQEQVPTAAPWDVSLHPVNLAYLDCVRRLYGTGRPQDGAGVVVGVVDTGVGDHPDLTVAGGANTVLGENPADYTDNGDPHGTHVAGIIASRGVPPTGLGGIAPGVTLRSYRVFGRNAPGATNYAIMKAISQAVADGCHLVNLSLGSQGADPATEDAILHAWGSGTVVFAAAGNDGRQPVSYPAAGPLALAVSALGVRGTWPTGACEDAEVTHPFGATDPNEFVAAFSNVGAAVDLTGPGVGVVSTVTGGGYAPMSGTSMACPAVVGFAARLLAQFPHIFQSPPTVLRAQQISRLLLLTARPRGFPPDLVGMGLPV